MNEATWSGWRQIRRRLWIEETPAGHLGVVQSGLWYLAITCDGSTAGRRPTCARAQRLLTR